MFGITAYSVYVPRCRLDRSLIARAWGTAQAAGEIAVANYDEDALTMATDAALAYAPDAEAAAVDALYFASTSAPYREKQVASVIATACDAPRRRVSGRSGQCQVSRQFTTVTWSPVNNSIAPYSHCPS